MLEVRAELVVQVPQVALVVGVRAFLMASAVQVLQVKGFQEVMVLLDTKAEPAEVAREQWVLHLAVCQALRVEMD